MNEKEIRETVSNIYEDYISGISVSAEELGLEKKSEAEIREEFKNEIEMLEDEENYVLELMFNIVQTLLNKDTEKFNEYYGEFENYCLDVEMEGLCYAFDDYLDTIRK